MIRNFLFIFALISITACASKNQDLNGAKYSQMAALSKKAGYYKVGKPYKIRGELYRPKEDYSYSEVGVASWYGEDFHAKDTANGEVYDMNTLTAAHRTLPLPSIVKVTNLQNGRSLVVRVNDRGPFAKSRIIDISKRGAQILGFQQQGTTKVKVELLPEESKRLKAIMTGKPYQPYALDTQPVEAQVNPYKNIDKKGEYFIQAGAFANKDSADNLKSNLADYGRTSVVAVNVNGQDLYRVRIGPFSRDIEANITLEKVKYHGIYGAKIVQE